MFSTLFLKLKIVRSFHEANILHSYLYITLILLVMVLEIISNVCFKIIFTSYYIIKFNIMSEHMNCSSMYVSKTDDLLAGFWSRRKDILRKEISNKPLKDQKVQILPLFRSYIK